MSDKYTSFTFLIMLNKNSKYDNRCMQINDHVDMVQTYLTTCIQFSILTDSRFDVLKLIYIVILEIINVHKQTFNSLMALKHNWAWGSRVSVLDKEPCA